MIPFAREGDYVLSLPYFLTSPKQGDVIILRHPQKEMLLMKRITNIGGDKYWLEGDNRDESVDSRQFGEVSRHQILGKAVVISSHQFIYRTMRETG